MNLQSKAIKLKKATEHVNSFYFIVLYGSTFKLSLGIKFQFVAIQTKLPIIKTFVRCSEIVFIK